MVGEPLGSGGFLMDGVMVEPRVPTVVLEGDWLCQPSRQLHSEAYLLNQGVCL